MRTLILLLLLIVTSFINEIDAQPLYGDLVYDMPRSEAIKVFKKDKARYTNIDIGNGVVWRMYHQNFAFHDDKLKGVHLSPKGKALTGISNDSGKIYLTQTVDFLIERGYSVFIEPDYWDVPILYSQKNKHGIVLTNEEKGVVAELRPVPHPTSSGAYSINFVINNYDNIMNIYNAQYEDIQERREMTDF